MAKLTNLRSQLRFYLQEIQDLTYKFFLRNRFIRNKTRWRSRGGWTNMPDNVAGLFSLPMNLCFEKKNCKSEKNKN